MRAWGWATRRRAGFVGIALLLALLGALPAQAGSYTNTGLPPLVNGAHFFQATAATNCEATLIEVVKP